MDTSNDTNGDLEDTKPGGESESEHVLITPPTEPRLSGKIYC